jgi:hypothetical protein
MSVTIQNNPPLNLQVNDTQKLALEVVNENVTVSINETQDIVLQLGVGQGPAGVGADLNYLHDQAAASDTWTITHNLSKYPSVTVVDTAGDEVEGAVNYISANQLVVTFSAAFSGKAYLN